MEELRLEIEELEERIAPTLVITPPGLDGVEIRATGVCADPSDAPAGEGHGHAVGKGPITGEPCP